MPSWLEAVAILCRSFLRSTRAIYPLLVVADKMECQIEHTRAGSIDRF